VIRDSTLDGLLRAPFDEIYEEMVEVRPEVVAALRRVPDAVNGLRAAIRTDRTVWKRACDFLSELGASAPELMTVVRIGDDTQFEAALGALDDAQLAELAGDASIEASRRSGAAELIDDPGALGRLLDDPSVAAAAAQALLQLEDVPPGLRARAERESRRAEIVANVAAALDWPEEAAPGIFRVRGRTLAVVVGPSSAVSRDSAAVGKAAEGKGPAAAADECWIVDPDAGRVEVVSADGRRSYGLGDEIVSRLPGVRVHVSKLYE